MRKSLPFVLILLGAAVAADAQEVYSISANAGQVQMLDAGRVVANRKACLSVGQPSGCTQSQACVARGLPSNCTAAAARAAQVRVFPNTQAGREEFLTFGLALPGLNALALEASGLNAQDYCVWFAAQNQTVKDAECSKIGAPAGCNICP